MRELKFRGISNETNEWVYGSAIRWNGLGQIIKHRHRINNNWVKDDIYVFHESIGQFTGLKDCNGKEVYEGDILRYSNDDKYKFTIQWNNEIAAFEIMNGLMSYKLGILSELEVIGNIHQNIELLNS